MDPPGHSLTYMSMYFHLARVLDQMKDYLVEGIVR